MSPNSPEEDSGTCSAIFPYSGSMRSGRLFQQPKSARRTSGSDSSCWPTAQAHDVHAPKTPEQISRMRARGYGVTNLTDRATMWSTPTARDYKDGASTPDQWGTKGVNSLLGRLVLTTPKAGPESSKPDPTSHRLSPRFVEWLMGFMEDWTLP